MHGRIFKEQKELCLLIWKGNFKYFVMMIFVIKKSCITKLKNVKMNQVKLIQTGKGPP